MSRNPNPPATTTLCSLAVGSGLGLLAGILTVVFTSSYIKSPQQLLLIMLIAVKSGGVLGYAAHQCSIANTRAAAAIPSNTPLLR